MQSLRIRYYNIKPQLVKSKSRKRMQEVKIGLLSRISKTHHPQPEWKMRVASQNTIYSLKFNAYIYISVILNKRTLVRMN